MTQAVQRTLVETFRKALGLPASTGVAMVRREDLAEWDSIGHMALVSAIEETFGFEMSFDEVLALDSFEAAMEIVTRHQA